jgi:Flp pilus assembly protein TadG
MLNKKSEKGQAIIMIVFSIIGLVALTGLTVDGGRAFSDRRAAQGAADSAAWAAGLANARNSAAVEDAAQIAARIAKVQEAGLNIADKNKYGAAYGSNVTVNVVNLPVAPAPLPDGSANPCPDGVSPNVEITVSIKSQVNLFFAPVIGLKQMTNNVQAVSRACGTYIAPIFGGNAIVSCGNGMTASDCAYNGGNSNTTDWTIHGGGVFSGTCAFSSGAVALDSGKCFSAVNVDEDDTNLAPLCANTAVPQCTPGYLDSLMPLNPCDYTDENDPALIAAGIELINSKLIHLTRSQIAAMPSPKTFKDAIYCINDLGDNTGTDPLSGENISLNNATLYITDLDFDLKFTGGAHAAGGFSGSPTVAGTYARYAIIIARDDADPCIDSSGAGANDDQVMDYRGSSGNTLNGTILAPTACIDMRGNTGNPADTLNINSQIIANRVSSNGNATITVVYDDTQNRQEPVSPVIILVK